MHVPFLDLKAINAPYMAAFEKAAAEVIQRVVDPEANIIFGMTTDHKMENEIKITIIATGFPTTDTLLQRDMARTVEAVNKVEINEDSLDLPPFLRRGGGNI